MSDLNGIIKKMRARDPKIHVTLNPGQSAISMLRGNLANPVNIDELKKEPYEHARQFIKENIDLFGKIDETKELISERALTNRQGMTHVAFQQKFGDALVLGGLLSVHYGADGAPYLVKSTLASGIDVPKKPEIPSERAIEIAKKHAGDKADLFAPIKPALMIIDAKTLHLEEEKQKYYLCWRMAITIPPGHRKMDSFYFVDAINGEVRLTYPAIKTGTGVGYYSHGTAVNSEPCNGTYRLRDTVASSAWPVATKPVIHTFDDNGSTSMNLQNYSEDPDDNWDNGGVVPARGDDQRQEVDIHRFMGYVLSYYYLTFGHNGWDGLGADMKGHAHNEYYNNNAFWTDYYKQIFFASGDGASFDFMCPLDVVGHETTHGVNYGLNVVQTYDGETGALNEGIADLFGCLIALDHPADCPQPWKHGQQYRITGRGRDMADPSRDDNDVVHYDATSDSTKQNSVSAGYYPDHYSIRFQGSWDLHGVHANCPIISHAVYLMINGGTHRLSGVTVTGIGIAPVERMLFEVISTPGLLNNSSDFADFRLAFIEACQTLYPENLDYLATIKTAFYAVGIGPDLYIRDTLTDIGDEPGVVSCMSPDIILRRQQADAAMLAQIGDFNNASLCETIEMGHDNYVYFRLFNRGSMLASGTFRLFISPASTFPTPNSWHEVGHYDFPGITENGGSWIPTASNQCITLPKALIDTLGIGHFCFIGIIESPDDPAPDRTLIDTQAEFHDFISKSNNYAWRNCDVVSVASNNLGEYAAIDRAFRINGFDRKPKPRDLEIDTRELPAGTQLTVWIPETKLFGIKVFEVLGIKARVPVAKIAGTLEELSVKNTPLLPVPMTALAETRDIKKLIPHELDAAEFAGYRPLCMPSTRVLRIAGLTLTKDEKVNVRFIVKFPRNTGTRDVTLAFRERIKGGMIGQMNYIFRIRK